MADKNKGAGTVPAPSIEERLKLAEFHFNEIQAKRNELLAQAQALMEEMIRLQGEHRLLKSLQEESQSGKG